MSALSACVYAPTPLLSVTIEAGPADVAEVHVHAAGQGFWIGRMAAILGLDVTLCGVFGGELGSIIESLIEGEGIGVRGIHTLGDNGSYVHDRRGGQRQVIVEVAPAALTRHEVDDLLSTSLAAAITSDVAVLGGPHGDEVIAPETYTRLAADIRAMNVPVVADLSGPCMCAALAGGIDVLKVSHEDLVDDGRVKSKDSKVLVEAMKTLMAEGARTVVVSRAGDPALALIDGDLWEVVAPPIHSVDPHGAGDSMTAGIAAALAAGESVTSALQLGAAAGAANVTRRGLATGQRDLVEELTGQVQVRRLKNPGESDR